MESEKVKEIKKALECCIVHGQCDCCIFREKHPFACLTEMHKQLLTLINELESENERLLEQRNKTYNIWIKDTEKAKDQIAELEEYIKGNQADAKAFVDNWHSDLKKELINFAERLKEKATILNSLTYDHRSLSFPETKILDFDDIDETLQECLND